MVLLAPQVVPAQSHNHGQDPAHDTQSHQKATGGHDRLFLELVVLGVLIVVVEKVWLLLPCEQTLFGIATTFSELLLALMLLLDQVALDVVVVDGQTHAYKHDREQDTHQATVGVATVGAEGDLQRQVQSHTKLFFFLFFTWKG